MTSSAQPRPSRGELPPLGGWARTLQRQRTPSLAAFMGLPVAQLFADAPAQMSGADIEAVLVRASRRMAIENNPALGAALLRELIHDFQPPAYPLEIEYQRLIAAFECTSRRLLPPDLAALSHDAIAARLAELRTGLGR